MSLGYVLLSSMYGVWSAVLLDLKELSTMQTTQVRQQEEEQATPAKWMTLREVRDALGIGRTKLTAILERGKIETRNSNKDLRKVYVDLHAIERYLADPF